MNLEKPPIKSQFITKKNVLLLNNGELKQIPESV
jgi:hypothetical protein